MIVPVDRRLRQDDRRGHRIPYNGNREFLEVSTSTPRWLIGRWRLVHAAEVLGFIPGTGMEFDADGKLRYLIPIDGSAQTIELVYRVEDDLLRTENPFAPHATATPFHQGPADTLVLDFADSPAVLVREHVEARGW